MKKIWEKKSSGGLNELAELYNSSISVDSVMYRQDIRGSIAHARMLSKQNIISDEDGKLLADELEKLLSGIDAGEIQIDYTAEDIHSFVEAYLISKIGDAGKKLHTGRSRNDQVATDLRLYLRDEVGSLMSDIKALISAIVDIADQHKQTVMPGYTHLQRAQPVSLGHYILAYAMMLDRDISRLENATALMNSSPLGLGAMAGTTYDIDRQFTADMLGFDSIALNSLDGVSDRDFCIELNSDFSIIMMHLSRFAEELILWSSQEFAFVSISDDFSTGSSIMPQKKNPDIAELIRGKTGRVYGNLMGILTVMKGLPLAYNKDMQEDKENIFDSLNTVSFSVRVFASMLQKISFNDIRLKEAADGGFINATDLADYLVKKGMPFRTAYVLTGEIIEYCSGRGCTLTDVPMDKYRKFSDLFDIDLYEAIDMKNCIEKRSCVGGPSLSSIMLQIEYLKNKYEL